MWNSCQLCARRLPQRLEQHSFPASAPEVAGAPCGNPMRGTTSVVPPMGPSPRRFLETQASQQPDRVNKGFFEALGPLPVPPILDTQRAPGQLRPLPSSTGSWEEPRKC